MIQKIFTQVNGKSIVRVTFRVPKDTQTEDLFLVGDFNEWNPVSHPFQMGSGGKWSLTVDLETGRAYQFRYFSKGKRWMHDSQADAFVFNPHSHHNFVVITDPNFKRYEQ